MKNKDIVGLLVNSTFSKEKFTRKIYQFEFLFRVIEKSYRWRGTKKGKENSGNIIVQSDDDQIGESKNLFRKCAIERSNI